MKAYQLSRSRLVDINYKRSQFSIEAVIIYIIKTINICIV